MRYSGKGLGGGVVMGQVALYKRHTSCADTEVVSVGDNELSRFDDAVRQLRGVMEQLKEKTEREVGQQESEIFGAYLLMLEDPEFRAAVKDNIAAGMYAADAVHAAADSVCDMLRGGDVYIAEREADIKAVAARLAEKIHGGGDPAFDPKGDEPYILVADDLNPEELMRLDSQRLAGLVTVKGSAFSHTSILATAMDIPMVVGLGEDVVCDDGDEVLLDGDEGIFIIRPDETEKRAQLDRTFSKKPADIHLNGGHVKIYANAASLRDSDLAVAEGADGIGLFRTEFLCVRDGTFPSHDEQYEVYSDVVRRMRMKRVVFRVFDIRGDKGTVVPEGDDIWTDQIKAILRASCYGDVHILFPMVDSAEEMRAYRALVVNAKDALLKAGIDHGDVSVGAMIETPKAVLRADEIAVCADFFSVGTNDLIQFLFGIDRHSPDLDEALERHRIEVLASVESTVKSAHAQGIEVGICGELAADIDYAKAFIAMGVDSLSVRPGRIPDLKTVKGG